MILQLILTAFYIINGSILLAYGNLGLFGKIMLGLGLLVSLTIDYLTYKRLN
jgi:hypothetical protein